jgi:hypothetical protein
VGESPLAPPPTATRPTAASENTHLADYWSDRYQYVLRAAAHCVGTVGRS